MAAENKGSNDAASGPDEVSVAVARAKLRKDLVRHGELAERKVLGELTAAEQEELLEIEVRLTTEDSSFYDPLLKALKKSALPKKT